MSINAFYPPGSSNSNASVGANGDSSPLSSTQIGFDDSGLLVNVSTATPLPVDVSGTFPATVDVNVISSVLPTGAATEAKQDTGNSSLSNIDGKLGSLGQKAMAGSAPVVIASDQSAIPVSISSGIANPLPVSDAALTDGTQKTKITDGAGTVNTKTIGAAIVSGDVSLITQSVIHGLSTAGGGTYVDVKVNPSGSLEVGTVAAVTSITNALPAGTNILGKVGIDQTTPGTTNGVQVNAALPAGSNSIGQVTANAGTNLNTSALNLEATQSAMSAKLPATLGQKTMANSMAVTIASDQSSITTSSSTKGLSKANTPVYNDYSSGNITTAAYTQLIASTSSAGQMLEIFDSSGQAMILAFGAGGAEVDQFYVPPGGGSFQIAVPASTRISYKAKTATASSGYLLLNVLG